MKNNIKNIIHFLYEVGTLRKIPRAHMQALMTSDLSDNIASHSYRVTMIGWFLAISEKADVNKVIQMCLLHDVPETRSGDQNYIHKRYVKVDEDRIHKEQLNNLPKNLKEVAKEYDARKTLEAKIAKDADILDQVFLLKEYVLAGNQEAESWLQGSDREKRLFTKTAKKMIKEIKKQKPHDWERYMDS